MSEPIFTAGLTTVQAAPNPRRDAIRAVRAVMRNPKSTDEDVDDALEALVELSKD